jgi:hypothetical protein
MRVWPMRSLTFPTDPERMTRIARSVAFAIAMLAAGPALAAPSRVRIVSAKDADAVVAEATTRLRAELETEGFEVVSVIATAGDPRAEVEAADDSVFASIAILRSGTGPVADVWVADHVTGKTLVKRVDADAATTSERPRALAIRAVDLLRASLLEVASTREATRAVPVPKDVARWIAPPPRRAIDVWSVEVGVATTKNVGFGPTLGPYARFARALGSGFGVRATWIGPTFGADIVGAVGTAQTHQALALAELTYAFIDARISPRIAFGVGAADTFAEGSARAPYVATSAQGFSLALTAAVGLRFAVAKHFGITFDTGALVIAPTRAIALAGVDSGNISALSWLSSLGIVVSFE